MYADAKLSIANISQFLFVDSLQILYAYIAIIITNSIAHPYIRISLAYTIFAGSVYVNSENIAPAFSPKSFLICVYPNIPSNAIDITENIL